MHVSHQEKDLVKKFRREKAILIQSLTKAETELFEVKEGRDGMITELKEMHFAKDDAMQRITDLEEQIE